MDANLSADRAHRGRGTLRPVTSPATGLDLVASWPVAHAAVGWRHRDGRVASVGDGGRRFALASVTKLLTASAVLMAVEEEIVVQIGRANVGTTVTNAHLVCSLPL